MPKITNVSDPEKVFRNIRKHARNQKIKLLSYGVSKNKDKKYYVEFIHKNKKYLIHFGNIHYEDYTKHKNKERRQNYLSRASGITNSKGELTYTNPIYANFWAYFCLW